jgi:cell division septation protein DedD
VSAGLASRHLCPKDQLWEFKDMKVICPKCQFENQADATRIVCARCATIIEVRLEQGTAADPNSKRQTARLPFTGNNGQPLASGPLNQRGDVYATHIGDDFEDVLDLPRQTQAVNYQPKPESEPVFDDVFTMPNYDATASYDFSNTQPNQTTPVDTFQTAPPRQRETQDYAGTPEPEFMGWPVLPAGADEEEQAVGATSNRGGLLLRVALILLVFGVLSFLVYSLLWDQITKRREQADNIAVTQPQDPTPAPKPSVDMSKIAAAKPAVTELPKPMQTTAPANEATKSGTEIKVPPVPVGPAERTQPPKPAPTVSAPAIKTPSGGNLTLQIGSFPDQGSANARATKLKESGADARVVKAEIPGKGTWYRVQVGGFGSRSEAQNFGNQLRSKGAVQDFIITGK